MKYTLLHNYHSYEGGHTFYVFKNDNTYAHVNREQLVINDKLMVELQLKLSETFNQFVNDNNLTDKE